MAVETRIMNCIMCPLGCEMTVTIEDGAVTSVTGNTCPRGPKYAHDEVVAPRRMLTSTVQVKGGLLPLLPVVSKTTLPVSYTHLDVYKRQGIRGCKVFREKYYP